MAAEPTTRLGREVIALSGIGPNSNAPTKFILDSSPLDGQNPALPSGDRIIIGRLLPKTEIYRQGSIKIHIEIGPLFPFNPPLVRSETKLYHPNVNKEGYISIDLLNKSTSWTPSTSLVSVIEKITEIIDTPSLDMIQYAEAANCYDKDLEAYKSTATAVFNSNCSLRN